jgi:transcription elongation factor Elf1
MTKIIWTRNETDELVTTTKDNPFADDNLLCPLCNHQATYEEGQIGQDFMGNDEHGFWYTCRNCGISTQAWNLDD